MWISKNNKNFSAYKTNSYNNAVCNKYRRYCLLYHYSAVLNKFKNWNLTLIRNSKRSKSFLNIHRCHNLLLLTTKSNSKTVPIICSRCVYLNFINKKINPGRPLWIAFQFSAQLRDSQNRQTEIICRIFWFIILRAPKG